MDLYSILGVDKNATEKEIKKAYRKLAKEHHPDKGGDTETFKQIEEAKRVLLDSKRRKLYDEGGDYNTLQTSEDKIRAIIYACFDAVINSFGFVPDHSDLIGGMKGNINDAILKIRASLENAENMLQHHKVIAERIKKGDMLIRYTEEKIRRIGNDIADMNRDIETHNNALEFMEDWIYEYEKDEEPLAISAGDIGKIVDDAEKGGNTYRFF